MGGHRLNFAQKKTMLEKYDLKDKKYLDITETEMKDFSEAELMVLTKVFQTEIQFASEAVQGIIDYTTEMLKTSKSIMSGLDLSNLATAMNEYYDAHAKKESKTDEKFNI